VDLKIPRIDKDKGITYVRMARPLDDLVAELRAEAEEMAKQKPERPPSEGEKPA
jgi:hypothetical protein